MTAVCPIISDKSQDLVQAVSPGFLFVINK